MPSTVKAYGVTSSTSPVTPLDIQRRDLRPNDVEIDIAFCGICHSDLHAAHGDWNPNNTYPLVPGHEIIGVVKSVGPDVKKYKAGDKVGVGCLVDSCGKCDMCKMGEEIPCVEGCVQTYNSPDPDFPGKSTYGGYSQKIVVQEHFVLSIPDSIYKPAAAPLLCAGITTWTPLAEANIKPGQKVGVVGLGGLGHMGVKLAAAMGAEVYVITTSAKKAAGAKKLGAKGVVVSTDDEDMKAHNSFFDFILNTIPVRHDIMPYIPLMKFGTTQVLVGSLEPMDFHAGLLIFGKKSIKGSPIGSIKETQAMLDFCAKHDVLSDIEMTTYDKINEAWERVQNKDVEYRFVLDNSTL